MRMEQYLTFTNHALWEVIVNGYLVLLVASASAEGPIPPKTAEQKPARKNELKAKSTLMLAIPDEHLLKFHACKDANPYEKRHESNGDDNQVNDRFKKGEGYHTVPPPYTRNYMPPRADLSFVGLVNSVFKSKVSETITSVPKIETNTSKTSKDSLEKTKTIRFSAPLIEDWESDSKDENVFKPKEVKKQSNLAWKRLNLLMLGIQLLKMKTELKNLGSSVRVLGIQMDEELALRLHEEEKAELERMQRERSTQEVASNAALTAEFDDV
nr:hypothetical protein [Tanacetum cinerariifolium]